MFVPYFYHSVYRLVLFGLIGFALLIAPAAQAAQLKILTLNVWGLPAPIGQDLDPRMERIKESIQDYDLVALQETFDHRTNQLSKTPGYPYAYHHQNGGLYLQNSGLMILSRHPIVKVDFLSFPFADLPDSLAQKGVLFVRIDHPELGMVDLYDTHYQSTGGTGSEVRIQADNQTLKQLFLKHNQYYPTIFAGDFNFLPNSPEHQNLNQSLPMIDTYAQARSQKSTQSDFNLNEHHTCPAWRRQLSFECRIDYIFILKSQLWNYQVLDSQILYREPVRGLHLSDHLGVASTIEVQRTF